MTGETKSEQTRINEETRRYVEKHGHRYCIMGHIHMPEMMEFWQNVGISSILAGNEELS